jgi:Fe-S-cluster containining protein
MAREPDSSAQTVTANVNLNLSGTPVVVEITVPLAPFPLPMLLPTFRSLAETIVDQAVENTKSEALTISCRSGCGACCRQLVPISEVEARLIRDLVRDFPEPRRSTVLARFVEARRRLEEAGLLEMLLRPETFSDGQLRPIGLSYFAQGIPCPFLENESCSIYDERPIACREYLVTSPAEHCAKPSQETVHCVELAAKVSRAVNRIGHDPGRRSIPWVPLMLALEWAESHPDELLPRPGPEWLREFFSLLTGRDIPPPTVADSTGDRSPT